MLAPGLTSFKIVDNLDQELPGTGKYIDLVVKGANTVLCGNMYSETEIHRLS